MRGQEDTGKLIISVGVFAVMLFVLISLCQSLFISACSEFLEVLAKSLLAGMLAAIVFAAVYIFVKNHTTFFGGFFRKT